LTNDRQRDTIQKTIFGLVTLALDFLQDPLQIIACAIVSSNTGNLYDREPSLHLPPGTGIGPITLPFASSADAIARWACAAGPPPGTGDIPPNNSRAPVSRSGGWCDVSYNMTVVWDFALYPSGEPSDNPPTGSAILPVLGPIVSFYTDSYPSPNLKALNAAGTVYNVGSISNDNYDYGEITSVTFARIDGQPDICQPDPNRPIAPPITIPDPRLPTAPPIIITPIAPIIVAPIGIYPRFVVDIGGVELTATVNVRTGDISIGGPGDLPPDCCCLPPRPPVNTDPPPPGEPPQETQYLVGIHTRATISDEVKATEIIGSVGDRSIYVPRLGSVNFLLRAGTLQSWSRDYDIKMQSQFIAVEGDYYATNYQVIEIPGVSISVTPVYVTV
jgi:hypothetical protein